MSRVPVQSPAQRLVADFAYAFMLAMASVPACGQSVMFAELDGAVVDVSVSYHFACSVDESHAREIGAGRIRREFAFGGDWEIISAKQISSSCSVRKD